MNIKTVELITAYQLFDELGKKALPLKMSYWVNKNIKLIEPEIELFTKERDKIFQDCLFRNEEGSFVSDNKYNIVKGKEAEFIKSMNELNDLESDFTPYIFTITDDFMEKYEDMTIEPKYLRGLDIFINYDND